jgi:hypothetical protein
MRVLFVLISLLLVGCSEKREPFQLSCGGGLYNIIIDEKMKIFHVNNETYKLLNTGDWYGISDGRFANRKVLKKTRLMYAGEGCIRVKLETSFHNQAKQNYYLLYK